MYHFNKQLFYISNTKKASIIKEIFNKENISIHLRKIFIDFDDFVEKLKDVSEISFTDSKNLFNQDNKQRQALIDLTGTDAPNTFTICAKYKNENMSRMIKWLKNLTFQRPKS